MKTGKSVIPNDYINFAYYAQGWQRIGKRIYLAKYYLELLLLWANVS